MGIFDFFRTKKKQQSELDDLMEKIKAQAFPGGTNQMKDVVERHYSLFNGRYTKDAIFQAMNYMASLIIVAEDKSARRVVDNGVMHKGLLSREDAIILYKNLLRIQFESKTGIHNELAFDAFYTSIGNIEGNYVSNEMPGAYGEYGLTTSNPIPINGIPASYAYMDRLRQTNGNNVSYKRIGTFTSEITDEIIDGYKLYSDSGIELATIYICPYVNANPSKAPKGFVLIK